MTSATWWIDAEPRATGLTTRQTEALQAYVDHSWYGDAARSMGITYSTFKNHLHEARKRAGVRDTHALAVLGYLRYWIQ